VPIVKVGAIVKLTEEGNRALADAAKQAGCSKGEMIERLLGLMFGGPRGS